jgi:leucokinin receptor
MRQKILFQLVLFLIISFLNKIKSEYITDYISHNSNTTNFNDWNDSMIIDELLEVSWATTTIFTLLFGALSVLAISGNSLILWCVIKNPKMHNVTNYFICNLAMADIVIGLFAIPFQVKIFIF